MMFRRRVLDSGTSEWWHRRDFSGFLWAVVLDVTRGTEIIESWYHSLSFS